MQQVEIKLKIADIVIKMLSEFKLIQISAEEQRFQSCERFKSFLYSGRKRPDILINVKIVKKLPYVRNATTLFVTRCRGERDERWHFLKNSGGYIFRCPLEDKKQVIFVNKNFDRATAYLLPKPNMGYVWDFLDIIYDFLQILLINYLAKRKVGIFVHAVAIKDRDGKGFIFAGESGAGKSTIAQIWHNQSKATVLSDDRIIVKNQNGSFLIYGTPWHGSFDDYLASRIEPAILSKLFFIYHSLKNTARPVPPQGAFKLLYPTIIPTFWSKAYLENIISFCQDLTRKAPCFNMGFAKNKKVIDFVRNI